MGSSAPLCDISPDKIVEFETTVMTIPQFDTDNPQMISQGPSVCIFNKTDSQEVLASWLFAQYLLTNDVQIAYSETEGYVPVTSKAQNAPEYQDYLSRCGEDNSTYYDIKIQAASLLLDNVGHTFVTPVFNGSTSLRDAAGHLIETTVKSVNRKQTVDDAFIEKLYDDTVSLYRLNRTGSRNMPSASDRAALGALPVISVILLSSLAAAWGFMLLYLAFMTAKKKRNRQ